MKKMIDKKVYDTESSTLIKTINYEDDPDNLIYATESLYIKKNREFFLYCEGLPFNNSMQGIHKEIFQQQRGTLIFPLDDEQAEEWIKKYTDKSTYDKLFSDNIKTSVYINIERKYHRKLKQICLSRNITYSEFLKEVVDKAFNDINNGND